MPFRAKNGSLKCNLCNIDTTGEKSTKMPCGRHRVCAICMAVHSEPGYNRCVLCYPLNPDGLSVSPCDSREYQRAPTPVPMEDDLDDLEGYNEDIETLINPNCVYSSIAPKQQSTPSSHPLPNSPAPEQKVRTGVMVHKIDHATGKTIRYFPYQRTARVKDRETDFKTIDIGTNQNTLSSPGQQNEPANIEKIHSLLNSDHLVSDHDLYKMDNFLQYLPSIASKNTSADDFDCPVPSVAGHHQLSDDNTPEQPVMFPIIDYPTTVPGNTTCNDNDFSLNPCACMDYFYLKHKSDCSVFTHSCASTEWQRIGAPQSTSMCNTHLSVNDDQLGDDAQDSYSGSDATGLTVISKNTETNSGSTYVPTENLLRGSQPPPETLQRLSEKSLSCKNKNLSDPQLNDDDENRELEELEEERGTSPCKASCTRITSWVEDTKKNRNRTPCSDGSDDSDEKLEGPHFADDEDDYPFSAKQSENTIDDDFWNF